MFKLARMERHSVSTNRPVHRIAALVLVLTLACGSIRRSEPLPSGGSNNNWMLPMLGLSGDSSSQLFNRDLEREGISPSASSILYASQQHPSLRSPSSIAHQYGLFRNNGRLPASDIIDINKLRAIDLFQCVDPSRALFESFVQQYNRTFADSADKLERLNLFAITLKRAIMLNRIVQNEILNRTNYQLRPEIRNYHFVEPTSGQNGALWYADITDCELGLIKKIIFDIFYLIDINDLASAYKIVQENREYLALLTDDGFEQLAEILLIRLYDRFRGDEKMNQLFQWPMYMKKLASFIYSQQQASQPGYKTKLALISFAYPAYFKDLKYNLAAINRTDDNLVANEEHKRFNQELGRKFANLNERNRRLAIFRQRWTLLNQFNDGQATPKRDTGAATPAKHASLLPDWLRVQYLDPSELAAATGQPEQSYAKSDKLIIGGREEDSFADAGKQVKAYKLTQFSDLTDVEFVAFLSNDFSLLDNNRDSAAFLERNFPVRPLNKQLRWEIATELELRRATSMSIANQSQANELSLPLLNNSSSIRAGLRLAKQVVDELISDVGLPIGPTMVENISETEHYNVFTKLARFFEKSYFVRRSASGALSELSDSDMRDESQHRYELFKQNYGRFRAWWIKENWQLDDAQHVAMLRLADMTWLEIKLTLFKVCCLTNDNLNSLGSINSTIQYLGSNNELMCEPLGSSKSSNATSSSSGLGPNWYSTEFKVVGQGSDLEQQQQQRQREYIVAARQQRQQASQDLNALELYYYYCVHFNKHHLNEADFERRLEIFRRNVDAIRHHSCKRSLTLYEAFKLKRPDILSTIDVIDSRRSHIDDLNLDRFEYFSLLPSASSVPPDLIAVQPQSAAYHGRTSSGHSCTFASSRAGVSYKREFFSNLLSRSASAQQVAAASRQQPNSSYADKLVSFWQDVDEYARRYHENHVKRVYDLVVARYKFCLKTLQGVELDTKDLRQQCQASGPLADQAAQFGPTAGAIWSSLDQLDGGGQFGRLRGGAQAQPKDQCAFYREGLEPWSEGLIRQDTLSAQLIQSAKC